MTKLTKEMTVYPISRNKKDWEAWRSKTGKLPVRMTNDYLFRALLQTYSDTLKHLIASLLGIDVSEIHSVEVTNPIMLGSSLKDKFFVLDARVLLNNHANLNLEMQVCNEHNWTDRSLGYLCRMYDDLNRGNSYGITKPAIQISFLDFTLFKKHPEFFAQYQLLNVKNQHPYTDKFRLYVIDLTKISLATKIDRKRHIDLWAKMFKAKTWEDLRMIAHDNEAIEGAVSVMNQMIEDERIRWECEQREELILYKEMQKRLLKQAEDKLKAKDAELKDKDAELKDKDAELKDKDAELKDKDAEIKDKEARIKELEEKLRSLESNS